MTEAIHKYCVDDFDYELPRQLIAGEPTKKRDRSRLLVLSKSDNKLIDEQFSDLANYLRAGDLLILNNTKVFPARLFGHKKSGGKVEILAERILDHGVVKAQLKANRTPAIGSEIIVGDDLHVEIAGREDEFFLLNFPHSVPVLEIFKRYGHVPLPPYIERIDRALDAERYQTVYAKHVGAVAAPTAGLHFTQTLLERLQQQGVNIGEITLHVGAGTFKPVKAQQLDQHKMHAEHATVSSAICNKIKSTKRAGGRVIAVGTTCVRALESAAAQGELQEFAGETNIFIYPGFQFRVVDGLITNFHLPRSTLIMLVSAFAGYTKTMQAYKHAVQKSYRFFSYGDAMLIVD